MKALDTNILVRFLINDDEVQGEKVRQLFKKAEASHEYFFVTNAVVLETLWVLSAVYDLSRDDILGGLELLAELPILRLEDHNATLDLVRLGRSTKADLPDLLIGLSGRSNGCKTTLTFDKGTRESGLFERF